MEMIRVGSKWKDKDNKVITVTQNFYNKVIEYERGAVKDICYKGWFEEHFTPCVEFEWVKVGGILVSANDADNTMADLKPHELLYNYNRYRELVETDETDENGYVWSVFSKDNELDYNNIEDLWLGEMYFSSKEHAKAFVKLAKENDCL